MYSRCLPTLSLLQFSPQKYLCLPGYTNVLTFSFKHFLNVYFVARSWRFLPKYLQYYTMMLPRPRIIVGDAGFEPRIFGLDVWRAANVATTTLVSNIAQSFYSNLFHLIWIPLCWPTVNCE